MPDARRERLVYDFHVQLAELKMMLGARLQNVSMLAESRYPEWRQLVTADGPLLQTEFVTFGSLHLATDVIDAELDSVLSLNGKDVHHGVRWDDHRCYFVLGEARCFVGSQNAGSDENTVAIEVAKVVHNCISSFIKNSGGRFSMEKRSCSYTLTWCDDQGRLSDFDLVPCLVDECGKYWVLPSVDQNALSNTLCMSGMDVDMMRRQMEPPAKMKTGLNDVIRALKLMAMQAFPGIPKEGTNITYKLHGSAVALSAIEAAREMSNVAWDKLRSPPSAGERGFIAVFRACLGPLERYLKMPSDFRLASPVTGEDLLWVFKPSEKMNEEQRKFLLTETARVVEEMINADEHALFERLQTWRASAQAAADMKDSGCGGKAPTGPASINVSQGWICCLLRADCIAARLEATLRAAGAPSNQLPCITSPAVQLDVTEDAATASVEEQHYSRIGDRTKEGEMIPDASHNHSGA